QKSVEPAVASGSHGIANRQAQQDQGERRLPLQHELAVSVSLCIEKGQPVGCPFFATGPQLHTNQELVTRAGQKSPKSRQGRISHFKVRSLAPVGCRQYV